MTRSAQKSLKSTGPMLPGMEISQSLTQAPLQGLISSVEGSPANRIVTRERDEQAKTSGISGQNLRGLFASLNPAGLWLKTCWGFLVQKMVVSSVPFLGTWPKQGTMRNGCAYERPTWEHHINESACSSWRTPQAQDAKSGKIQRGYTTNLTHQVLWPAPTVIDAGSGRINKSDSPNATVRPTLALMARKNLWPTPVANDAKNVTLPPASKNRDSLPGALVRLDTQGNLNPCWVETLMGFPPGWTDISGPQDLDLSNIPGNHRESRKKKLPTKESD